MRPIANATELRVFATRLRCVLDSTSLRAKATGTGAARDGLAERLTELQGREQSALRDVTELRARADNLWALTTLPALALLRYWPWVLPRAQWVFYAYYPLHVSVFWLLAATR